MKQIPINTLARTKPKFLFEKYHERLLTNCSFVAFQNGLACFSRIHLGFPPIMGYGDLQTSKFDALLQTRKFIQETHREFQWLAINAMDSATVKVFQSSKSR